MTRLDGASSLQVSAQVYAASPIVQFPLENSPGDPASPISTRRVRRRPSTGNTSTMQPRIDMCGMDLEDESW